MPNQNDEDVKWLYGKLKSKGYDIGSEQEFQSSLANDEDRKWYYDKAKGMGLNVGTMDDFNSLYAPAKPQPQQAAKPKPQPTSYFRLRRGGKDFNVPTSEVKEAGGLIAWANRHPGAPVRVYMQDTKGGDHHVDLRSAHDMLANKGYKYSWMYKSTPARRPAERPANPAKYDPAVAASFQGVSNNVGQMIQADKEHWQNVAEYNRKAPWNWAGRGTVKGQEEINPETGKMEQTYLTPTGEKTTDKYAADQVSRQYRDAMSMDERKDDVVNAVWDEAEKQDENSKKVGVPDALGAGSYALALAAETANEENRHRTYDFDRMADEIYNRLPEDYKNNTLAEYKKYFDAHPNARKGMTADAAAEDALKGQMYQQLLDKAKQKAMPKSAIDYLANKINDNFLTNPKKAAKVIAAWRTGSHGLEDAQANADAEYSKAHPLLNVAGGVIGVTTDPFTYISGGAGALAGKAALKGVGKFMLRNAAKKAGAKAGRKVAGDVAGRYAAGTLGGRIAQGVAGGAGNFGTFNTLGSIESQVTLGGTQDEYGRATGQISVGDIMKETGKGLILGSSIGVMNPLLGNAADKIVKKTSSTAGKVGVRVGQGVVCTLAEGTIFALPDMAEQGKWDWDTWTDNQAMMLGFKASHAIKSAPRVIQGLSRGDKRIGLSFEERLRRQLDASPADIGFMPEELAELRDKGYGDLSRLFSEAGKPKEAKGDKANEARENGGEKIEEHEDLPQHPMKGYEGYEDLVRLVKDRRVSEATRAKAYYIVTGHMLPMSTVVGLTEDKGEDGSITVSSVNSRGGVVTSRKFANEKDAQPYKDQINRQAELNTITVGESYREDLADKATLEEAIRQVDPNANVEDTLKVYDAVKKGKIWYQDAIDLVKQIDESAEKNIHFADEERPAAIRERLNKQYGLDVDKALRKEPSKRTEEEQDLIHDYATALFPKQGTEEGKQADAEAQIDADFKKRIEEQQSHDDGLNEEANDKAEDKRAEIDHQIAQRTNKQTGMIHPATLKVDNRPVYIVSGNVVMFPDGSGVDKAHSSESVVVCDAETGEVKFISPDMIYNVEEPINADQERQAAYDAIESEDKVIFGNDNNGDAGLTRKRNPQQGDDVWVKDDKDQAVHGVVTSIDPVTGDYFVRTDEPVNGKKTQPFSKDKLFERQAQEDGSAATTVESPEQPATAPQQTPAEEQILGAEGQSQEQPKRPIDRIPSETVTDEKTKKPRVVHHWEQAAPEDTYDALNDQYEDEELTQHKVGNRIKKIKDSIKAVDKQLKKLEDSDDFDADFDNAEGYASLRDEKKRLEEQKKYWQSVLDVPEARRKAEDRRKAEERAERDREEAERKAAEQEALGAHAVNPKIKAKWDNAPKVEGNEDVITLPDGSTLKGHYVLVEAGAATASHDAMNGFVPTEGFPVDENGQSVNDRDYYHDNDAQAMVRGMARGYDSRAMQTPVIVSRDGVVLSGNNRTMSGDLAARDNTDGAYIDYLTQYGQKYGFDTETVKGMQHPRVLFVADEQLPYDAGTFARFNAQEMKSQSKPEAAIKLGKVVSDDAFARIVSLISKYDNMSDFYANTGDTSAVLTELMRDGAINDKQLPELRTGDTLSAQGRELLENMLIGKVFQSNPDTVRKIISMPALKQSIVMGLNEIADNRTLAPTHYDLIQELSDAIDLVYRARTDSPDVYKVGVPVSSYGRQLGLFSDESVTDAATLLLADVMSDAKPSMLRKVLATYDKEAVEVAGGQMDLFEGRRKTKEELLQEVINLFNNATAKEQQDLTKEAVDARKRRAREQGGDTTEQADASEEGSGKGGQGNSTAEKRGGRGYMGGSDQRSESEKPTTIDENGYPFVKAPDGTTIFGEVREDSGLSPAPIRLSEGFQDENGKGYGLAHIEANHGEQIREAGFSSVEEFVSYVATNYDEDNIRVGKRRVNGNTTYLLQVSDEHDNTLFVELSRDGTYWNVNSAGIFRKGYSNKKETVAKTEPQQPNNAVSDDSSLSVEEGGGIATTEPNGKPAVSVGKTSDNPANGQGKDGKLAEKEQSVATGAEETAEQGEETAGANVGNGTRLNLERSKKGVSSLPDGTRGKKQLLKYLNALEEAIGKNDLVGMCNAITGLSGNAALMDEQNVPKAVNSLIKLTTDWLKSKGYDMSGIHVGSKYDEGMRIHADFMDDPTLPPGTRIIKRIRKPKIIKDGELFQKANVVVAQNLDSSQEEAEQTQTKDESNIKKLEGEEAEKALTDIFDKGTSAKLPPIISSQEEFDKVFNSPVRTVIGEVINVGRNVFNKVIRKLRQNISGAIRPTLEDADFVILDTDGSRLYVKLFEKEDGSKTYNVTVVNKTGEIDDYISSVHIKRDTTLLNKLKAGAQLLLPSKRNSYEEKSSSSQTPVSTSKDTKPSDNKQEKGGKSADGEDKSANFHKVESDNSKKEAGAPVTEEEAALRKAMDDLMRKAGIEVIDDVEEGQRVLDEENGARLSKDKKRALETASVTSDKAHQPTVVSSADGAKILNDLDNLANEYENKSNRSKTFVGDLGRVLKAERKGSDSQYATFETKSGKIVTIRLADHNAKVSNFDQRNEDEGISIVISSDKNAGLTNDGDAHIVEYYYNAIKLRKADGKPLADIARSIKQALYSGEYKDTTGLAERQEVNAGEVIRYQKAYHGSGADFEEFDTMNHLGEGEGSQAFGAGTYVADQKGLGEMYAKINKRDIAVVNGKEFVFGRANKFTTAQNIALGTLYNAYYGRSFSLKNKKVEIGAKDYVHRAVQDIRDALAENPNRSDAADYKEAERLIESGKVAFKRRNGVLYTVEVPDDNGKNYLDWDGALTREQADTIRKRLYEAVLALNDDYKGAEKDLARDLSVIKEGSHIGDTYGTISDYLGSDKAASDFLHHLGYTGIKVHAAHNSGDARYKDNWNYVIFNDADLKITDKVKFFRTADGEAYGFTVGGKIYIDPRVATSETPIHEYTHLWAEALRKANPKEWRNVVKLMKGTWAWDYVKRLYPELKTDDEIAKEALAHFSGKRGAERLREVAREEADKAKGIMNKAAIWSAFAKIKDALGKYWKHIAEDILHIHFTTAEEVADKVMYDLMNRVNPTKVAFDMKKPVEESGELVAVHNIGDYNLRRALKLGGFPMPSIAITKPEVGHTTFGDISLLFGKESINPADKRNKVYSGDSWTPEFPRISTKLNEKISNDLYERANKAKGLPFVNSSTFYPENLQSRLDGDSQEDSVGALRQSYDVKQMFLQEKGNPVDKFLVHEVEKFPKEKAEILQQAIDKIGLDRLRKESPDKMVDELKPFIEKYYNEDFDAQKPFIKKSWLVIIVRDAVDYSNGNTRLERDFDATRNEIDSRIDNDEYNKWLNDNFGGLVEKQGIRNGRDLFTPSGNRLEWDSLYDEVTLDNLVRSMERQAAKGGSGLGSSIFGAATKKLPSIEEIRKEAEQRVKAIPAEEHDAERDAINSRMKDITLPSVKNSNDFSVHSDFDINVINAVAKSHTAKGIYNYLKDYYDDMTMDVAEQIADVVKDIQKMSTRYLEAKPYRVVGFDEVKAAVVPDNTSKEVVDRLKDKGIKVYTYEKGNAEERRQVVNDAAQEQRVKFHKAESGNTKNAAENDIETVNERFNEGLKQFEEDKLPIGSRLGLGMPSPELISAGFPYLPISMRVSLLKKKAGMAEHPFDPSDLKDLVKALQKPIAVFKYSKDNMRNVIVDVKHGDKHFLVGVTLDYKANGIEINSISGLFPKESHEWIKWIQDGKAIRIDQKDKVLNLIASLRTNPAESMRIGLDLDNAAKLVKGFENPPIEDENLLRDGDVEPATAEEAEEGDVLYRECDDDEQARLDAEPTVKVYRAMQEHDGKLYPPMSGRVKEEYTTKKGTVRTKWVWREPTAIGKWEQSEEHPEKANEDGTFTLDKGNGSTINAAYNPYIHTSRSPINDQFSSAWNRPELVTVEVEVPASELTSGYHAEKAKDATGEVEWKSGPVGREMAAHGKPRMVILSRWDKPVRIVPVEEVADEYAVRLAGTGIKVPFNTVPPALRDALVARGVEISEPEEGNAGKASRPSYEEWLRGDRYRVAEMEDITKGKFLFEGKPVSELDGTEFGDLRKNLKEEVANYFANEWKGAVERPGFGDVILDKRSVKDDVSHGMNRQKAASFMAVPYIIRDGVVIDEQDNWKGRNYDSVTIAAPITIAKERYIGIAIVKRQPGSNRFYLHTVMLQKSLQDGMLRTGTEAASRQGDIAKILNNLYNAVTNGDNLSRDGDVEPAAKGTDAEEKRKTVEEMAQKLHLAHVDIVTEPVEVKDKRGRIHRPKGSYSPSTDRITVYAANNVDVDDVMRTVLHEGVAHHGLRQLFGEHFADFLHDVYRSADENVRRAIAKLATGKYGGNFETATEEYLASLAEKMNFESVPRTLWIRIRHLFEKMLRAIGLKSKGSMSDNELRYILWKSYKNLKVGGKSGSILDEAEDVAKQYELKVGNFAEEPMAEKAGGDEAADENVSNTGDFGPIFYQFKGKSKEAIAHLMSIKDGEAVGALHHSSVGDIDLVWGEEGTGKSDGYGLAKLVKYHPEVLDRLQDILNDMHEVSRTSNRVKLESDRYEASIRLTWNDKKKTWLLTAFEKRGTSVNTTDTDGTTGGGKRNDTATPQNSSAAKVSNNPESEAGKGEKVSEAPKVWGKKDLVSKAEQVSDGVDPKLLFRDSIDDNSETAQEMYNRMADADYNKVREAWQDSMINVRNLQEAVLKERGEELESWEDAYLQENNSHGRSRADAEYFQRNLYRPLIEEINKVAKKARVSVGDVTQYLMAKHGLERNEVFARRDAERWAERQRGKGKEPTAEEIEERYEQNRHRDYSGLTALTGEKEVADAEAEAWRIVEAMEGRADTAALWDKVNACTKWTLRKSYDSGVISKDNYEQVRDMFGYYIPLRGWSEDTAGDLYDYVGSGDRGTAFSPTLHGAKGRRSEAENPIAYISQMAMSAIVQGNKNRVKQAFLRFVENHPTSLVTVSEMWYRNTGTKDDPKWEPSIPDIPENATADEVAEIVTQHEQEMKALEKEGMTTKKRGGLHLGVPVRKGQELEHHVVVNVNGKQYVMYINGNPRAAQALNGTRERRAAERSHESGEIAKLSRLLAERYTSLSPAFTVSNAFRDYTMATASTLIKESPRYAVKFQLNVARLGGPARMFVLMSKYQGGKLDMGNETEKYFYEFMTQGAETGFTSLREIEDYKKEMRKEFEHMNRSVARPKRLLGALADGLEYTNRCIEDMTRFATYMASRQSGRNIDKSVEDAKNITLNFNRKGSGEMGNATYRNLQIFVNPAIQALQNVASMAKRHPIKFGLATGSIALIGMAQAGVTALLAGLFGGDDDDKFNPIDEYWKLPTWQRRNNFVFWIPGTHNFAMIPLAQEFRVFHGFGETISSVLSGHSDENPALELASQASDLLPLDFTGNNGNPLVNLAPTVTQPLLQVGFNTDFTGRPLYKDNDFNKYEPSFQKAYVGTPSWLIKSSEFINDFTGGNDHKQGWWERTTDKGPRIFQLNNPAIVDHYLKGYLGGLYSFLAQLGGTMLTLGTGNMPDAQEVPIVNRVVTSVRETQQNGKTRLPDWYYDMNEQNERWKTERSGFKKDYLQGDMDAKQKWLDLEHDTTQQKRNAYINMLDKIRTALSRTDDAEQKARLTEQQNEVLDKLKSLKGGAK